MGISQKESDKKIKAYGILIIKEFASFKVGEFWQILDYIDYDDGFILRKINKKGKYEAVEVPRPLLIDFYTHFLVYKLGKNIFI